MDAFATVEDVTTIWGDGVELNAWQRAMIEARIEQASADIRECTALVGGNTVDQRVSASPNFAVVVRGIVTDMLRRFLTNPDGRLEVGVDDTRVRWNAVMAQGELVLTDNERSKLSGGAQAALSGAFTVRPGRAADDTGRASGSFYGESWLYRNGAPWV